MLDKLIQLNNGATTIALLLEEYFQFPQFVKCPHIYPPDLDFELKKINNSYTIIKKTVSISDETEILIRLHTKLVVFMWGKPRSAEF